MKKLIRILCRPIKCVAKEVFFIPFIPILKIRTGLSYNNCKNIVHFFWSAAFYRKQYFQAFKTFYLLFFRVSWNCFLPNDSLFAKKKYKRKNPTWKIGQWYGLSPKDLNNAEITKDSLDTKYFSIGREAISHILKNHPFDTKIALLPIFTCFTVITPFLQDGWEVHFYRFNENLTINTGFFLDIFSNVNPSVCVFQPLSGMGFLESENSLIEYAQKHGCITIVDQTQDIYNDRDNPYVDYYCASMRKWYPFPDGALLHSKKYPIDGCENLSENTIYRTSMGLCMFAAYLRSVYSDPFFVYLYNFMWTFSVSYIGGTTITTHTMSDYSRKILSLQDEQQNVQRRKANFRYIYEGLQSLKHIRPAFGGIERLISAPLSFPIYTENRQKLSQHLALHGITTQLLWEKPKYIKNHIQDDETTEYIYAHILSLPCDQRYDTNDMEQMLEILREYDRQTQ